MAALYDGDGNRMFTADRTEDTNAYQLFARKKAAPKTSTQGEEGSIFWDGFGQNFIQALHAAKEALGRVWKDTWEDLVSAYHRKIAKDRADEEGLVVNPDGITDMPGDGDVTYPSETGQALIPYQVIEETYDYYEVRNYVNDINQEYTQVLSGYDEKGRIRESYTYGITGSGGSALTGSGSIADSGIVLGGGAVIGGRLDYSDGKNTWYYGYTGTGSVSQLTDRKGVLAASYSYDAFGNTSVQDHIGNITGNQNITENYTLNPYTYRAEYTDASTGNQFLRARYYSPETGNFFTEDSYLGSLLEPLERNLYTYAGNDPVNYQDPSGHGFLKNAWKKVQSVAKKVADVGKKLYNKAKAGLNNYMNSSTYQNYFKNAGSSGSGKRTGASTGNGYVGKSTGGGSGSKYSWGGSGYSYGTGGSGGRTNGYTSYSYVKYNPNPPHKLTIGGKTRYYQTEAEMNTARKVCETADKIKKGEITPTVKHENLLKTAATGLVLAGVGVAATVATGGTAVLIPGLVGMTVGGMSGGIGSAANGGNILDGILSGMVNGAITGMLSGTLLGSVGGNLIGGLVGGMHSAFLEGDNDKNRLKTIITGAIPQTIISGAWGGLVGKVIPISNTTDAIGSGVAAWPAEMVGVAVNAGINVRKK